MRILFVNEYIYPNVVSGAEFSMQELALALKEREEEIIFFGPDLTKEKIKIYKGIKIIHFPFIKNVKPYYSLSPFWFNNPIFWLYSAVFLLFACLKAKANLIHVHGKYLLPAAIIVQVILRIPVVVTIRDYKFLCPLALCLIEQEKPCDWDYFTKKEINFYLDKYEDSKNYLTRLIVKTRILSGKLLQQTLLVFLKRADRVVCVSQAVLEIYKKAGLRNKRLIKIFNLPPELADRKKSNRQTKTVLYVGKLSYGKGTDILIKAFLRVKKLIPAVRLILIGNKSPSLKVIPKSVNYLGLLPHDQLKRYYKKAAVFVMPSRWPEPLSRSALEAMSFGLPLIVSDKGGNKELVVNGKNGYIISLNETEVAQKILYLIKKPSLAVDMGQQSRKILEEKFNRQSIISKHLKLYKNKKK